MADSIFRKAKRSSNTVYHIKTDELWRIRASLLTATEVVGIGLDII